MTLVRHDLYLDIMNNKEIREKFKDDVYASLFYGSITNTAWEKKDVSIDNFIKKLSNTHVYTWSFRTSAGMVAKIRNGILGGHEGYMDWYCSSSEGVINEEIREDLEKIGWFEVKGYYDC